MSFPTVTVEAVKKGAMPTCLEIYVHKLLDPDTYLVGDKTDQVVLTVADNPIFNKHISIGGFYRLIKPNFNNGILKLQKIGPLPIAAFNYASLKGSPPKLPAIKKDDLKTFEDVGALKPSTSVPNIVAKVVHMSPQKQSRYSKFRTVGLKDVKGNKNFVSLYGAFAEQVEEDKVYSFKGLSIQDYKGPHDSFNRLATKANSSISEQSSGVVKNLFSEIKAGDGILKGVILGHEEPYTYMSCPFCGKANFERDDSTCNFCKKSYVGKSSVIDFNVTLAILLDDKEETVRVFCFRRHLNISMEKRCKDELQKKLCLLHFKACEIEYLKDSVNDGIRALRVLIKDSS